MADGLNALPKSPQPTARRMLSEIRDAEDRDHALCAIDRRALDPPQDHQPHRVHAFACEFGAKWPKALANSTAGSGGGDDVRRAPPEPERPVGTASTGAANSPALEVTEEMSPGLGRLPVAVGDGHQLRGPVGTHTTTDQGAQAVPLRER